MRRHVARAVQDRLTFPPGPESGHSPVRRPVAAEMSVVDGDRERTVRQPVDHGGPGLVAGPADLGAVTGLARPPLLQPVQIVAVDNVPWSQAGGQIARYAVLVPLDQLARDV